MTRPTETNLLLDLTPLEASDVLFELVLTSASARERALAIARERTRLRRPPLSTTAGDAEAPSP